MKKPLLLIIFCLFLGKAFATHNRAGEITYQWITGTTYKVTITTYTKESVTADRCELELFWGDSTSSLLPRINGTTNPGLGQNPCPFPITHGVSLGNDVQKNVYEGTHTYSSSGVFILYFEDPNRNAGIANIIQSVNVVFYVQSELVITPSLGPNNSPQLLEPPIADGCINQIYKHNTGAYDIDGDSLAFRLVPSRKTGGAIIPTTYDPTYVTDSVKIDPFTGDLIWDKPRNIGQFNFAIEISEFRKKADGSYVRVGYVIRDLQIDILNCGNQPPEIEPIGPFCVEAGQTLTFDVVATDPDTTYLDKRGRIVDRNTHPDTIADTVYDGVILRAFGGPFAVSNPATFTSVAGNRTATGTFLWNTACNNVRQQPYFATFEAQDIPYNTKDQPLLDLYTVEITVVAPAPKNPVAIASNNTIQLKWESSICREAIGYKIYRREDSFGFVPAECELGVPAYTGYQLIDTTGSLTDTSYIDSINLEKGKRYCYMVVACFADGAESYASEEFCAALALTLPLITNVDVVTTDPATGIIDIKWIAPPVIDTPNFPPPYSYKLFRTTGLNGQNFVELQTFNSLNDTSYTDSLLNTEDSAYSYRIDFFSGVNQDFAGSSSNASSVYLEIIPFDEGNFLDFTHNTPWLNYQYIIYRDTVGDRANFHFLDTSFAGSYRDTGLVNGKNYCYYAESFGRYSANDGSIPEPLINRSQINCAIPVDTNAPCPPLLSFEYNCELDNLLLEWNRPDGLDCKDDIVKYYIYYKPSLAHSFSTTPIDSVSGKDFSYLRSGALLSPPIPGCYAITAIDDANLDPFNNEPNESSFSNIICVAPCPSILLPNYFTPNGDDIEDFFTLADYASRDIKEIRISVFNRWGIEVFQTNNIEKFRTEGWDGTDKTTGQDCVEGVYFYVAFYTPLSLDIVKEQKLEGFVHLIR